MKRAAAVVLLALIAAMLVAPAARADSPGDPAVVLEADIAYGLDRAAAYWGGAPACQDGVQIVYAPAIVGNSGLVAETFRDRPSCRIFRGDSFTQNMGRLERCKNLAHEWGHLLGHDHSPAGDPDNIMVYNYDESGGTGINTASTCYLASVPVTAAEMVAAAWAAMNPAPPIAPFVQPVAPPTAQPVVTRPTLAAVRAYKAKVRQRAHILKRRAACLKHAHRATQRARCRARWPRKPAPARPR